VDNGTVANRDPVADDTAIIIRQMQHSVVLDVRVVTDDDAVDVAAEHRAIPHARMRAEGHVAEHDSGFGEINAPTEFWFFAQERVELFANGCHAEKFNPAMRECRGFSISFGGGED